MILNELGQRLKQQFQRQLSPGGVRSGAEQRNPSRSAQRLAKGCTTFEMRLSGLVGQQRLANFSRNTLA